MVVLDSSMPLIQEFNLSLLAPCLGLGLREISGGQKSPLFEAAQMVTLERMASMVQQLPAVHQVFQPFLPVEPNAYWNKLDDLFGNDRGLFSMGNTQPDNWVLGRKYIEDSNLAYVRPSPALNICHGGSGCSMLAVPK